VAIQRRRWRRQKIVAGSFKSKDEAGDETREQSSKVSKERRRGVWESARRSGDSKGATRSLLFQVHARRSMEGSGCCRRHKTTRLGSRQQQQPKEGKF
jgi:hypothetical protein